MKTLHLLRHAKSSWDKPGQPDRERGLNKRGQRDAPRMGEALSHILPPMSVALSPARRAQLTLEGLCRGWPALADCRHYTEEDLYTFDGDDLLDWVRRQDDRHLALFIIGHNPALTDLVNTLVAGDGLANLPTAGYVRIECPGASWAHLGERPARLARRLFPKELPGD
ncbi:histidine phosphatase family protein [Parahaliea mediterranea]|uniref:Histidine phosphatase family protein n=2 Tax=Parahaliea mediterranea TaxID=651086 RepID=A0A939DCZ1_9GAMM|nr:histidine phosphatase family protein [Parahaliea mediterranea]MBN7795641.1 histidine phosphatase family protein [Parahaliea mediterranea]